MQKQFMGKINMDGIIPESNENMCNSIGLLKLISQGESDVRNGRVKSQEDVFKDIENSLKEKF